VTTALESGTGILSRFDVPLYTVAEAARYLDVPESTLRSWTHGYRRHVGDRPDVVGAPFLTSLPRLRASGPVIPFVGLAEGLVLTAMRSSGVPLQRIRPVGATTLLLLAPTVRAGRGAARAATSSTSRSAPTTGCCSPSKRPLTGWVSAGA
jgi:hypothetical protein